ncbi:MAG: YbaK/EbsC family protein [Clostridia bacterium]|nr:YbaK/EbsC family protein [Clostridia bacterium]
MSIELVRNALQAHGLAERIIEFSVSSATVALAAEALGCDGAHIAKSLTFHGTENTVLLVAAGDARIDNAKFKAQFGCKAKMLTPEEVIAATGHAVGGVCPFALPESGVEVWLDISLQRFSTVYPACGSSNSAIPLDCETLFRVSGSRGWVDVCRGWNETEA